MNHVISVSEKTAVCKWVQEEKAMEEPAGTGELPHSNPFLSIAPPALQGENKEKEGPEDHSPAEGAAGQYGAREAIPSSILPPPALPHTQPKSFFQLL